MNSHMNRVLVHSIVNCVVSFWRQTPTQLLEVTAAQNSVSDPTNSTALDKFYDKDQRREAGECRERLVSKTRSVCEKRRFVRKNPMLHGYKSNNSISMHSFRFNLWSLSLGDTPEVMRESPSKWSNWKPSFDKYHGQKGISYSEQLKSEKRRCTASRNSYLSSDVRTLLRSV